MHSALVRSARRLVSSVGPDSKPRDDRKAMIFQDAKVPRSNCPKPHAENHVADLQSYAFRFGSGAKPQQTSDSA